jgi:hypothetical protein
VHRLDQIAVIAATRNLSGPPVFRKWNKRPNQFIIVGGAWQVTQNCVQRLAALNRRFFG